MNTDNLQISGNKFLQHYIQNMPYLMWFLGAGTSHSAGLPTTADIIWGLKRRFYCLHENQEIHSHDINNRATKKRIRGSRQGQSHDFC